MNTFDKNLKKKLYNAEMAVSDSLWASIESQIPVKKEKPRLWLLFLLVAFAVPFMIFQFDKSKVTGQTQEIAQLDKKDLVYRAHNESSTNTLAHKSTGEVRNRSIQKNKTISDTDEFVIEKKLSNANALSNGKTVMSQPFERPEHYPSFIASNGKKLKFIKKSLKNKSQLKLIEKSRIYQQNNQVASLIKMTPHAATGYIIQDEERKFSSFLERMLGMSKMSATSCPTFNKNFSGLYVFSDFNFGLTSQSLKTQDVNLTSELGNRKLTESNRISSSISLGLGKQFSSGLLIESGLNYDRITTSFSLENTGITKTEEVVTTITTETPNGPVTTVETTSKDITADFNRTNNFSQVNVPVNLGYQVHLYDRLSVSVKGGILLNLSSSNSGTMLDGEENLINYSSSSIEDSRYKTNLDLSYTTSINLEGDITRYIGAYLGIRSYYYPSHFNMSSFQIDESYSKHGLTMGLKYRI